jgi:hypothetical protein
MLSYLTNPNPPSTRQTNFTQTGNNIHLKAPYPCLVQLSKPKTCAQLFTSKALCEDEGGNWYGPDPQNPSTPFYSSCCAIQHAIDDGTFSDPTVTSIKILPDFQNAIRNDTYKVVQLMEPDCSQQPDSHGNFPDTTSTAFYQVDQTPKTPMLDNMSNALCGDGAPNDCPNGLTQDERTNYIRLSTTRDQLLRSEPRCKGDGNEDKVVNGLDIKSWRFFSELTNGGSSWSDFNQDGNTDFADLGIILEHLGKKCLSKK